MIELINAIKHVLLAIFAVGFVSCENDWYLQQFRQE